MGSLQPVPFPNGTGTFIPSQDTRDLCTLSTCPIDLALLEYRPNLAGNTLFLAIFAILLPIQVWIGIRRKTWGFTFAAVCGLVLEIVGYAGRIELRNNPFKLSNFLTYLVPLTLGPAFLTAAIYLCLARIVGVYGEHLSRIQPRMYTIIFITCDIFSLVLQAAGGAMASSDDDSKAQTGINLLIAGVSLQVVFLFCYMALCLDFAWRVYRDAKRNPWGAVPAGSGDIRRTWRFKAFLVGLAIATITIFVRCVFRIAELSEGFDGPIANDQVVYMILEPTMIAIACFCLTALHPGLGFQGTWSQYNFQLGKQRPKGGKSVPSGASSDAETQMKHESPA